jgi:hypothetical protein
MKRHTFVLLMSHVMIVMIISACASQQTLLPGDLTIEEYALSQPPNTDNFGFQPMEGSMDEILAKHAAERGNVVQRTYFMADGNPALKALFDGGELLAISLSDAENIPQQIVELSHNGQVIFTVPAGLPSPVVPLQGLWTYGQHWALEILLATPEIWAGQIYIDGKLINQREGYDEAFGFQLLEGKPFYFYEQDGQLGLSYDGVEANLPFDEIPHYQCCSESVLNPIQAENMVALFAKRGETWYYVELGDFR